MNKLLTGLSVWFLFFILMGIFFPFPTTTDSGPVGTILQSLTIYGFFSLMPIVFGGPAISLAADWLGRRIKWYFQPVSFFFHITGACIAYIVTQNIDITIMAVFAAVLFFVTDRFFSLMSNIPNSYQLVKNVPIVLGFAGVAIMILGSSWI